MAEPLGLPVAGGIDQLIWQFHPIHFNSPAIAASLACSASRWLCALSSFCYLVEAGASDMRFPPDSIKMPAAPPRRFQFVRCR